MDDDAPNPIILTGEERIEDLEEITRRTSIAVPEGYDRVSILMTADGGAYLVVASPDLPAMRMVNGPSGVVWERIWQDGKGTH